MKEELKKLGFTEEEADKVVANQDAIEKTLTKDKYVPLDRFNEVNKESKDKDNTITQLTKDVENIKSKVGDNEDLKKQIEDLQKTRKDEQDKALAEKNKIRKETALKLELANKVHDVDDAISKFDLDKIELDGETTKIKSGYKDQFESLKKDKAYMFVEESKETNPGKSFIRGIAKPKDGASGSSEGKENVNAGVELAKKLSERKTKEVKADDFYFGGNEGGNK